MDLKSMLNDSATQRPSRLHTPQSSHDGQNAPANEAYSSKSSPYSGPRQLNESRSQSGGHVGYPSPHQTNIVPGSMGAGTRPGYTQSPGPHPHSLLSRENSGAQHPYGSPGVAHSPSASGHYPPTPGGSRYQSHTPGSQQNQSLPHAHSQSPHGPTLRNGHDSAQVRQVSPHAQAHHQPQTPLGPPANFNRASPQVQRPPSQGLDQHYRKSSYGSTGSGPGKDSSHIAPPQDHIRAQSLQRQSMPETERARERNQSLSVSPKTIPKSSPFRQASSASTSSFQSQQEPRSISVPHHPQERIAELPVAASTPETSVHSIELQRTSRGASTGPVQSGAQYQTKPAITSSPMSTHRESPIAPPPATLKRNASLMSDGAASVQQPRKKLRRDEIPVWAQSIRKRPPRFGDGSKKARLAVANTPSAPSTQPAPRPVQMAATNGHVFSDTNSIEHAPPVEMKWEPTIANIVPEDDLSNAIGHWIHSHIGNKVPPAGAVFEIEAKVGAICDTQTGERIRLPVRSECITATGMAHTKFESSMDMEQHQQLNQYLNSLAQIAYNDPKREPVRPCHLRQYDDFFELTPQGLDHLSPGLISNKGRRPKVRKTTDKDTGQVRAMIVKTRIDDLEVYNPVHDFDFRISISIESNWEGDSSWLLPIQNSNARTRLKDRMSYRHGAIQVDLTQVSHEDTAHMEHELEVEVSVAMLQAELEKGRIGLPNRFKDLVKSLVDNARLLCRQGSLYRRR